LLVFGVTPFKTDQNKNKNGSVDYVQNLREKKVTTQRLSSRFRSEQSFCCKICGEAFSPNLKRFVWRHHVGTHPDGHQYGGWKPTGTSVTEFFLTTANNNCNNNNNNNNNNNDFIYIILKRPL